jgi:spore germination protein YaaH
MKAFFNSALTCALIASLIGMPVSAFTLTGISIPKSTFVSSGTDRHVSAWVPYWRSVGGPAEAQRTMLYIDTFSPFIFEAQPDGTIKNRSDLGDHNWSSLIDVARANNKHVIPTILWLKGSEIHTILSDKKKRDAHIASIVKIMKDNPKFHGIDIDYEGKKVETRVGFSTFITDLHTQLNGMGKYLSCTIETRNPNTPRGTIPEDQRSNDYRVLGKECDIIRVMTYDQQNADQVLSRQYQNQLYFPVADAKWVEKVLVELIKDIPKEKIELGIPTYGHVYKYTKNTNGTYTYSRMRALTYDQFMERSRLYSKQPERNVAGELSFTYRIETGELKGDYLAWFSDAAAVGQKVRLAEKYGIRGVAIFSISGANDPGLPLVL